MGIRGDHRIHVALVPEWQLSHSLGNALPEMVKAVLIEQSPSQIDDG
jgi:hypothetical protein